MEERRLGILIADVSGHGVPASLISAMVKIVFSSQLPLANDPARVLVGINQILCGKLESDFVTAGYLFIDTDKQTTATYAGAGHPPLLLWRGSEQRVYEYLGKGIILGQLEDAQYQNIGAKSCKIQVRNPPIMEELKCQTSQNLHFLMPQRKLN